MSYHFSIGTNFCLSNILRWYTTIIILIIMIRIWLCKLLRILLVFRRVVLSLIYQRIANLNLILIHYLRLCINITLINLLLLVKLYAFALENWNLLISILLKLLELVMVVFLLMWFRCWWELTQLQISIWFELLLVLIFKFYISKLTTEAILFFVPTT